MKLDLHSPGDGLFGTHITWEDIEKQIQNETNLNLFFGPKKNAQVIGEGNGFLSKVVVIEPDFQVATNCLPSKFVVKMFTAVACNELAESNKNQYEEAQRTMQTIVEREEMYRNMHNREVFFYRVFSRFDNSISKISRLFFAQDFTDGNELKGFIGMEYMENAQLRHIYHNVIPGELSDVLHAIAYLEAKSVGLGDDEKKKMDTNPLWASIPARVNPVTVRKLFRGIHTASEELKPTGEELEEIAEELVSLELNTTMNNELGMQDVLIHGDLWSTNMLWRRTPDGMRLSGIVDYQMAHFRCSSIDLCKLLITTLSGKDRRENWERLLEEFHGYIKEYCHGDLPFTLEQLKESYRRLFPLSGLLVLEAFGPIAKIAVEKLLDEEKKNAEAVLLERTITLIEDMLFFAKRNRDVRETSGK
ncbi:hypothetical protein NECAME_08790 [Necator americanus]|uniref:CHK kinase-like domain-containing protein n=1 Tax=Necator americanus TaxID=51031 RepID=W2TIP5_NECAM|nr:hypothetical protein NECAME_08790 [Necator americanus]ETN81036.1 hypothetical protein NECAME_08790 [Necator americanus]